MGENLLSLSLTASDAHGWEHFTPNQRRPKSKAFTSPSIEQTKISIAKNSPDHLDSVA